MKKILFALIVGTLFLAACGSGEPVEQTTQTVTSEYVYRPVVAGADVVHKSKPLSTYGQPVYTDSLRSEMSEQGRKTGYEDGYYRSLYSTKKYQQRMYYNVPASYDRLSGNIYEPVPGALSVVTYIPNEGYVDSVPGAKEPRREGYIETVGGW